MSSKFFLKNLLKSRGASDQACYSFLHFSIEEEENISHVYLGMSN